MPKISVIVAIYNVERYIEKCARSLFEQTLEDVELIFIDDCSPDRSIEIIKDTLKEYPTRIPQTIFYRMPSNSGQALVRRKGIELATGEYIIHCDSDDFVATDMYEKMYSAAKEGNHDIVICNMLRGTENNWEVRSFHDKEYDDLIDSALILGNTYITNKLVKSEIVKDHSIVYPQNNLGEDMVLLVQYNLLAESVVFIDAPLYYYRWRDDSISCNSDKQFLVEKFLQVRKNFEMVITLLKENNLERRYKDGIVHKGLSIKNSLLSVISRKEYYRLWKDSFNQINSKILFSRVVTAKEKLLFFITYLGLYPCLRSFISILLRRGDIG